MIVDDIIADVNILKHHLEKEYDITVAFDGESALEKVANGPPDLILLDIRMPGIDGYEVCRRLKADQNTERIPIVFITTRNEDEDEVRGFELGAIDYIAKPFSIPIIKARLKNVLQIKKMEKALENLSSVDGLTGIPNRRSFEQTLEKEWRRAIRAKTPLSVIIMDIDYFKKYNDHYGHPAGDQCLKYVAKVLSESLHRPQDFVSRYGGEEFVVLLPDTVMTGAFTVGDDMRQNVKNLKIPHAQSPVANYITISAGIANIVPTVDLDAGLLIAGADKALYKAKKESRNICRTCSIEDMLV